MNSSHDTTGRVRLDKWLWAARFFKTRSLAADDIDKGRVRVNGQVAKASREPKVGDLVDLKTPYGIRTVRVEAISSTRGPAPQAALLYQETPDSLQRRAQAAEQRLWVSEPARTIEHGRPTKRDRRQLQDFSATHPTQWDDRWSASLDSSA